MPEPRAPMGQPDAPLDPEPAAAVRAERGEGICAERGEGTAAERPKADDVACTAEEIIERVVQEGLLRRGGPVVVMLSGGRDSVCLIDLACSICSAENVQALHVNYGLRAQADEDEAHCEQLCERVGVRLTAHRVSRPAKAGNLQAWAREVRYAAARQIAEQKGALIAVGHTATDQVETILYRLAASPGRRALLGMSAREGRLIRPLLSLTREQTAAYCIARGLRWREDESNLSARYARNRVRHGLLEALRAVHPAAQGNVLRTAELLRQETALLDGLVDDELDGGASISLERLQQLQPALARLLLIRLAEDACGRYVPQAGDRVAELLELGRKAPRAQLHVGGNVAAMIEDGRLWMVKLPPRDRGEAGGAGGG